MGCKVVNVRQTKADVYIGRPSKFGNPFPMRGEATRSKVIADYRVWLHAQLQSGHITVSELKALDGKTLGCYCAPKPCHGDVLCNAVAWALTQD